MLLACAVGGLSLAAYREVRATTIDRATDVLERVQHELVAGGARPNIARVQALRALANDDAIVRALASGATAAEVEKRFAASRESHDTTFVAFQLASTDGRRTYGTASGWSATDSAQLAATLAGAVRNESDQRSPFYAVGEQVHAWLAVPVVVKGRVVGTVAELARVGDNYGADAVIRALVDDDARMLFTSRGSAEWVSFRGRPVAAPFALPAVHDKAVRIDVPGRGGVYVVQSLIPTTPWLAVLSQSERSILAKPHDFLRRLLVAGLIVLAVATVGAWFLGRLVTRPLREVTEAASDLAQGDYTRRVDVHGGGREVGRLASMFNAMAAATGDAHAILAERNAELQRANAAKAQFLAMMSHELRTPLNAIGGFTELMELGLRGPVTPEQVEDLGRIRRNKDLLVAIITDILDFSRTDAGALTVEMEPVAVAPLLTDVVDSVRNQMAAKGVQLEVRPVPADAVVRGDRKKIAQVLLNLLSNAMKFTEPGGEVDILTVVDEGAVRIDVRDTGSGISTAQLETIFEPFVQVDASLTRRAGGTGLGLAIARQLTRAMGGTVTVRSQLGAGSTFSLTLPRAELLPVISPPEDRRTPREASQVV
ncbi:MAG: HAMP domain-containing histidine kinase [Gemmatimonadetes bacterium]|nr:HAMP domain-containing histidine kinase [Gemmatimonadota bacterium]